MRSRVVLALLLALVWASPTLAGPTLRCQTHYEPTLNRLQTLCADGRRVVSTWSPTLAAVDHHGDATAEADLRQAGEPQDPAVGGALSMTPPTESSFMMTLIPIFLGGVVSSLLTLLLGQPLQHYFWRRQRYVERQFAMIEELNTLVAAMDFRLVAGTLSHEERQSLYQRMVGLTTNIRTLFSPPAFERCQALRRAIRAGLSATDHGFRGEIRRHIQEIHQDALRALYQDMGIPPTPPRQWMQEHTWQPLTRWGGQGQRWMQEHTWPSL